MQSEEYSYKPVTSAEWDDLQSLFGSRGACGGCWCMAWRLSRKEFNSQKGEANRNALHAIISSGIVPGILLYKGSEPIAWCSVAPRSDFPALERSRVLAKIDDTPVWSIVCFFVKKEYRRRGLQAFIIESAVAFAKRNGATIIESYPVEPYANNMPAAFAWTGFVSAFRKAGFTEAARRSKSRPIMRFDCRNE